MAHIIVQSEKMPEESYSNRCCCSVSNMVTHFIMCCCYNTNREPSKNGPKNGEKIGLWPNSGVCFFIRKRLILSLCCHGWISLLFDLDPSDEIPPLCVCVFTACDWGTSICVPYWLPRNKNCVLERSVKKPILCIHKNGINPARTHALWSSNVEFFG